MIVVIPEVLREKLGAEGARALAELLNEASVGTRGDVIEIAAGRFERRLAEEIGKLRAELGSEIGGLRGDLKAGLAAVRGDFDSKIGALRGDFDSKIGALDARMGAFEGRITRWMFVFWIGQAAVVAGVLFALLPR